MAEDRRTIKVDYLARVEGEGALQLIFEGDRLDDVSLKIFEPPRFFEAFLRGREYTEAPDITARICGICPVAYQMSAVHAMERALGVQTSPGVRTLRRLLYCGEWIESHALHVFMLHAPDFLGYDGAVEMAKDHRDVVELALAVKKAGNDIVNAVGGREVHPINVRVGGFYRAPARSELDQLLPALRGALDHMRTAMDFVSGLDFPDFDGDYTFVSLSHPDEYPFNDGRIVSSGGLNIAVEDYENHFEERHIEYSNALHSIMRGGGSYLVGPMARFNLCYESLRDTAKEAAESAGLRVPERNPFKSILVRCVELIQALDEAISIIESYSPPAAAYADVEIRPGVGWAATEAPRGLLYHRYELDEKGLISEARIVPPTSQNQGMIEDDLREFVPSRLHMPDDELTWQCEQMVRNYDPCISCATHFLKLEKVRR